MTNKDKALAIVDKLFEMCEKDYDITFSGHCGEMVIGFRNGNEDGYHYHIHSHVNFSSQLTTILQSLDAIEHRQKESSGKQGK